MKKFSDNSSDEASIEIRRERNTACDRNEEYMGRMHVGRDKAIKARPHRKTNLFNCVAVSERRLAYLDA